MEPTTKADDTESLKALLQTLVDSIRAGQEHNRKILENHAEMIKANRDAIAGLLTLVSQQNAAFNITRELVAKLFEELHPPVGGEGSEEPSVN
jgi:hypothetical protein